MEALRKKYDDLKIVEDSRDKVVEELFKKLNDMTMTVERNSFVVVLIDADHMKFLDHMIQSDYGGAAAAECLRRAVFDYLRGRGKGFEHNYKILIRLYANLRGLHKAYHHVQLPSPKSHVDAVSDFVLDFNKSNPLSDFIDAGNNHGAADTKLRANLNLYACDVHCKHIIFGGSANGAYASHIDSLLSEPMASKNITLIEGPPFAPEYRHLIKRRKIPTTSFPDVLSNASTSINPVRHHKKHDSQQKPQTLLDTTKTNPMINLNRPNTPGYPPSPKHSLGKSFRPRLVNLYDEDISEQMVKDEIIDITSQILEESPKHIDFGVIRERVIQTLLLSDDFWAASDGFWHNMSLEIIKQTVDDWCAATSNPRPANATWQPGSNVTTNTSHGSTIPSEPSALESQLATLQLAEDPPYTQPVFGRVYLNAAGQRVDVPREIIVDKKLVNEIRERKPRFCNAYHLLGECDGLECGGKYYHGPRLSDEEFEALVYICRHTRCSNGSRCRSRECMKGHMCPNGRGCRFGGKCNFALLHKMDTTVFEEDPVDFW